MASGDASRGRLTPLATARDRLLDQVDRTQSGVRPVGEALGMRLAEPIDARSPYPAFDRVTLDGFAVRAADTFDASDRTPARLGLTEGNVGDREAVRVEAGDKLPEGTNAVIDDAKVDSLDTTIELLDSVPEGAGVILTGGEVEEGDQILDTGHRLRPSDVALLRAVGHDSVPVVDPWTIAIIPTGGNTITQDLRKDKTPETNSHIIAGLLGQWGGRGVIRDPVVSKPAALRTAIERDLDADAIVTIGGTADGRRDYVPSTLETRGTLLANRLAISPGETTATGIVERTPIVAAPGPPIACLVAVVQLVRPLLKGPDQTSHRVADVDATLTEKLPSRVGVRSFAPVKLTRHTDPPEGGRLPRTAEPIRPGGGGLRSITRADGWTAVPEAREGYDIGEDILVEKWEW